MPTLVVDYSKTLSQVYQDFIVHLLQTDSIGEAFHYSLPSSQTIAGLPSWALAWQHDCCSEGDTQVIKEAILRHLVPEDGHVYTFCPLTLTTESTYKQQDLVPPSYNNSLPWSQQPILFLAPEDQRKWEIPRPLGDGTLGLFGRVIDYVAELTDYTCDLKWLVGDDNGIMDPRIPDCNNMYLNGAPGRLKLLDHKRRYDPKHDHRRLAILRTPANTHVAIVPADTEVGDFLVAVAPDVLPLVLSPCERSPPRAGEVYDEHQIEPDIELFAAFLKGERKHFNITDYLSEQRRRFEKVVEVFGPYYKMKGPAIAMQGYEFCRPITFHQFSYHGIRVERNWLRPMQKFIVR